MSPNNTNINLGKLYKLLTNVMLLTKLINFLKHCELIKKLLCKRTKIVNYPLTNIKQP